MFLNAYSFQSPESAGCTALECHKRRIDKIRESYVHGKDSEFLKSYKSKRTVKQLSIHANDNGKRTLVAFVSFYDGLIVWHDVRNHAVVGTPRKVTGYTKRLPEKVMRSYSGIVDPSVNVYARQF